MKHFLKIAALFCLLAFPSVANAAVGFIYIDTGGCETGSTTKCSGSTDSASASAKGAGSTITCSATSGVGAAVPGCLIVGTGSAVGQLGSIAVDGSQSVYVDCATNSNQKIFWITAVDNATGRISTISTVGTPITPTGCTAATSDWGIGGRMIYNAANIEAGVRAGDTILFNNTPASKAATFFTMRVPGNSTLGKINFIGKSGVRPVLAVTGNNAILNWNDQPDWYVADLDFSIAGTQCAVLSSLSGVIYNVKISGGTSGCGVSPDGLGTVVMNSEINVGGVGLSVASSIGIIAIGNYIHGCGSHGVQNAGNTQSITLINNLIVNNAGKGVYFNGSPSDQSYPHHIIGNTIANNTGVGLDIGNVNYFITLRNNIIYSSGTAVNWTTSAELVASHTYNSYFGTTTNLTPNSTETTSDPLFTNAGAGNYTLLATSPAKGTGYPGTFLNATGTGYMSMGAFQVQATGSPRCIGC